MLLVSGVSQPAGMKAEFCELGIQLEPPAETGSETADERARRAFEQECLLERSLAVSIPCRRRHDVGGGIEEVSQGKRALFGYFPIDDAEPSAAPLQNVHHC